MMILDKKGNLKHFYNLGIEIKDLRKYFYFKEPYLSVIGGVIGLVIELLLYCYSSILSL
jgi:lipoprotein-releasing system permease protein